MTSRPEILRRLVDVAKRHDPAAARGGTLHHFREAVLLLRARRLSYDQIARVVAAQGLPVSSSMVGRFCRRSFTEEDFDRARRTLEAAQSGPPRSILLPTTPAAPAPGAPAAGSSPSLISAPAAPRSPAMSSDTPARKRLLLFTQDKGGIGKSFVAALLHAFLTEAGV